LEASQRLPAVCERLAITAARTSLLLINFDFWIGSLWSDPLMLIRSLAAKERVLDAHDQNRHPEHGIQRAAGDGIARCCWAGW
jgi:hypothetical protein